MLEVIPNKAIQRLKDVSDIMHERSVLIYNEKKAALDKGDDALKLQVGEGRDIMSILRECRRLLRVASACASLTTHGLQSRRT